MEIIFEPFPQTNRLLFKKARREVGGSFRHHETMRHGAPIHAINVENITEEKDEDTSKDFALRRNYKKYSSVREAVPIRRMFRRPVRTVGAMSRSGRRERRPPRSSQYLLQIANKRKFRPPGSQRELQARVSGRRMIVDDLAASEDEIRKNSRRRSRRSYHDDNNALLDSARIKLENIIENFNEKLSSLTLDYSM